jgi:hypothetical protein
MSILCSTARDEPIRLAPPEWQTTSEWLAEWVVPIGGINDPGNIAGLCETCRGMAQTLSVNESRAAMSVPNPAVVPPRLKEWVRDRTTRTPILRRLALVCPQSFSAPRETVVRKSERPAGSAKLIGLEWSSAGRTRTYNPPVNSRMLCH